MKKKKIIQAEGKGVSNTGATPPPQIIKDPATSQTSSTTVPIPKVDDYDFFLQCIKRSENLIELTKRVNGNPDDSINHCEDAYRGAIVLAISALDALIRSLLKSKLMLYLTSNKPLKKNLKLLDYIEKILSYNKLLEAARMSNLESAIEKAIQDDFETKSFQGNYTITEYMELIGHRDIFTNVSDKANISPNNLIKDLNNFTKRRHLIVHCGDYNMNQKPKKENPIDIGYANDCINRIKQIGEQINELLKK